MNQRPLRVDGGGAGRTGTAASMRSGKGWDRTSKAARKGPKNAKGRGGKVIPLLAPAENSSLPGRNRQADISLPSQQPFYGADPAPGHLELRSIVERHHVRAGEPGGQLADEGDVHRQRPVRADELPGIEPGFQSVEREVDG